MQGHHFKCYLNLLILVLFWLLSYLRSNGCDGLSPVSSRELKAMRAGIYLYTPRCSMSRASPVAPVVKDLPANAGATGDSGSVPGLGRAPGGGKDNALQYSCLGNPIVRGA